MKSSWQDAFEDALEAANDNWEWDEDALYYEAG